MSLLKSIEVFGRTLGCQGDRNRQRGWQLAAAAAVLPAALTFGQDALLDRHDPNDIRVLSWNSHGQFRVDGSAQMAAYARVIGAIDPDVVVFQEITSSGAVDLMPAWFSENIRSGTWYTLEGLNTGHRNVIVSYYPLSMEAVDTTPASELRGVTMALVDCPDEFHDNDVYIMGVHFKAGEGEDARRQVHADAIAHWMGDARTSGDEIDLPLDTPMVVVGDVNFYDGGDHVYSDIVIGPDGPYHPSQIYRCSTTGTWTIGSWDVDGPPDGTDTPGVENVECDGATRSVSPPGGERAMDDDPNKAVDDFGDHGARNDRVERGLRGLAELGRPGGILINELRRDQPGTDNDEYFELIGDPGQPLDDLAYLVIGDSSDGGSGVIEAVISLSDQIIGSDGFFVVAESTFSMGEPDLVTELVFENNDNVTHLLVSNFSGELYQDLDTDGDGVLDEEPWDLVFDDLAMVGVAYSNQPDVTLRTGDIINEGVFGPDIKGDWDNSDITDPHPIDPVSGQDWTYWGYRSRTDRFYYTDSVAEIGNQFILNTTTLSGDQLSEYGLWQDDTTEDFTSKHLPIVVDFRVDSFCSGDVTGDGVVNVSDLLLVIDQWGPCSGDCAADLDGNGSVGVADLLIVLDAWGPCS